MITDSVSKVKAYLFLAIAIIVIVLVIYFLGRRSSKYNPPAVSYPNNGADIPQNWDASPLANSMHAEMDGFTLNKIKLDQLFLQLLNLATDEMFIAVSDTFNKLYMKEGNGTLRQWIEDEDYYGFPDSVRPKVYKRMDFLSLK